MSDSDISWGRELVLATATGAATALLPVHRWSPKVRWAIHAGLGVTAGAAAAWVARHGPAGAGSDTDGEGEVPRAQGDALGLVGTTGVALVAGAVTVASSVGGTALDRRFEHGLSRRGVARPRLWMGLAAGLVSLAAGLERASAEVSTREVDQI